MYPPLGVNLKRFSLDKLVIEFYAKIFKDLEKMLVGRFLMPSQQWSPYGHFIQMIFYEKCILKSNANLRLRIVWQLCYSSTLFAFFLQGFFWYLFAMELQVLVAVLWPCRSFPIVFYLRLQNFRINTNYFLNCFNLFPLNTKKDSFIWKLV